MRMIFIARQRAMHAERDIVLSILSVCPSVCPYSADIVAKRMDISSHFDDLVGPSF